jgi:hypothetical protein
VVIVARQGWGGPNVKSDDPRLIESHKRLTERIARLDNMILTVLKNHIAVEQFMGEFIEAHGMKSDDLTFADKIKACKARNAPEIEKPIWDLLKEANREKQTLDSMARSRKPLRGAVQLLQRVQQGRGWRHLVRLR